MVDRKTRRAQETLVQRSGVVVGLRLLLVSGILDEADGELFEQAGKRNEDEGDCHVEDGVEVRDIV